MQYFNHYLMTIPCWSKLNSSNCWSFY